MTPLTLTPGQTTLAELALIYRDERAVMLNRACRPAVDAAAAAALIAAAVASTAGRQVRFSTTDRKSTRLNSSHG